MDALGVITEYNPFHNGHLHHLEESKRLTGRRQVVAVMSGNFVQRGEPALCDKWLRTRMALDHGVDLVIELPVYFAAAGADYFARAAVKLLDACGIVDALCFGSESGDIDALTQAGQALADETPAFKAAMKENLQHGLPFAAAREAAAKVLFRVPEGLLSQPNNLLGVEYCKALARLGSKLIPYTVKRAGEGPYKPASQIRKAVRGGAFETAAEFMPPSAYARLAECVSRGEITEADAYSDIFQYRLRTLPLEELRAAAGMTEGLENRFKACSAQHRALSELLLAVKTKRYAYTRLQRAALSVVLNLTAEALNAFDAAGGPPYIRILGFRKESAHLLGALQQQATLPVLINLKQAEAVLTAPGLGMLAKEAETTALYALARKSGLFAANREYTEPLVIV